MDARPVTKLPFDHDKIRLCFETDRGAFDRAIDIARLLHQKDLWLADQLLYVEYGYTVHYKLFAFGGVDDFALKQMLVQYAPDYTTRRALYITPYAHDVRVHFAAEQLREDIRVALMEIQATPIILDGPFYRAAFRV